MRLTLPDQVSPAQPPPGDHFFVLVFVTMAAEVALIFLWAFLFAPRPAY